MQLANICINAIALFAAFYFLIALAAHLSYRWQNPIAKSIAPAVEVPPVPLLLPAVDSPEQALLIAAVQMLEWSHPFEASLQKMPSIEPIAVVRQPVGEVAPVEVAIAPTDDDAPALAALTIRQLKQMASDRKLPRYSSLTKPQLIAALG